MSRFLSLQAQLEKKKEKEKAKKLAQKEGSKVAADGPSLDTLDPETMKAHDAERMAKMLLEVCFLFSSFDLVCLLANIISSVRLSFENFGLVCFVGRRERA